MVATNKKMKFPPLPPPPECRETLNEDVVEGINGKLLFAAYVLSMVFIIVANVTLIYGLVRTSGKRFTSSTKYFLVLSSTDLLAGVVMMPIQLYVVRAVPNISCILTGVRAFFSVFPLTLSGVIIMVLTIDRYVVMAGRKKHNRSGYRDIVLYVSIAFLVSFGWGIWYTITTRRTTFRKMSVYFISLAVFEASVLITAIVFNFFILREVKEASKNTTVKGKARKSEQRLSTTITIISGSLVVMYIPSVIGLLVAGAFFYDLTVLDLFLGKVTREDIRYYSIALIWSLVPTLFNSGLNACIYIARNKRMRRMYTSIYNRNVKWNSETSEDLSSSGGTLSRNGTANKIRLNTINKAYTVSSEKLQTNQINR